MPHSDICGSIRICRSPQLFAACHVLHRLPEPRHPPCALRNFFFLASFRGSPHLSWRNVSPGLINTRRLFLSSCLLFSFLFIPSCQRSSAEAFLFFLPGLSYRPDPFGNMGLNEVPTLLFACAASTGLSNLLFSFFSRFFALPLSLNSRLVSGE